MNDWYKQSEKSAGKLRLLFLLYLYKIFGKRVLKLVLIPIVFVIWLKSKDIREASRRYRMILNEYQSKRGIKLTKFSSYKHMLFYSYSMLDKVLAFMGEDIKINVVENEAYKEIKQILLNNNGIILLSSHLGNVEVLPAMIKNKYELKNNPKRINVLMNTSQTPIFHNFVSNHTKVSNVNIISTQNLDVGTGIQLSTLLDKGEILIIPSDRTTNELDKHIIKLSLLDKTVYLSKGIFRIVKLLNVPTFLVFCIYDGSDYMLEFRKIDSSKDLEHNFIKILEENILRYPLNWFNLYSFFKEN